MSEGIYVGAYLLRVAGPDGALVSAAAPEVRPRPVRRGGPVRILPTPVPGFVDREVQVEAASSALSASRPVEFFGDEGAGKSALLAHLAHRIELASHGGGTVHLSARRASLEDVVQALFDALFVSESALKVSGSALRGLMSDDDRPAPPLILLDDVELEPESIEALVAAVPACPLVLASPERRLWGEGRSDALEGLDPEGALLLFERELGRQLRGEERGRAASLLASLGGRPLSIVLAAGVARAEGLALEEVERRARDASMESVAVRALAGDEARMAAALATLGGVEAAVEDLAAVAGTPDARAALDGLARRGIARRAEGRFGMAATLVAEVGRAVDLAEVEQRAAARLAGEAQRRTPDPAWVAGEAAVLLEVLDRLAAARRWRDALDLSRAVEADLALAGRWGAWEHVLELALQAARHSEDAGAEAWALHQRGTRALCLGAADQARQDLEDAFALRQALRDAGGAAASRHNLEHVPGGGILAMAAPPAGPEAVQRVAPSPWFFLALALAAVALVTIVLLAVVGGEEEPSALVAETEVVEYGELAVGGAGESRAIVVRNSSDGPVLVRAVRIEGDAERDFVVLRDDCAGSTLGPAETCSILTAFVPSAAGVRAADLVFEDDRSSRTVALTGIGSTTVAVTEPGAAPDGTATLTVTPARVEFGDQETGTTGGPMPITFVNRSAGDARPVIRLDAGPAREFAIVEDLCTNAVVPPGEACVVEVVFRPGGSGLRGAVMIVRDATTNETWTVALTGNGIAESVVTAEGPNPALPAPGAPPRGFSLAGPDQITFGEQRPGTRSTVQSVTVENVLDDEIRIATVRLTGIDAGSYGMANDRCSGAILRPGGRCALDVWFLPTDEGQRRASLVVRDGTGDVAREIVLTGTGG